MSDLHVVFGAGGGAGSAVVRALLAEGKTVRAVTRSGLDAPPEGVEDVRADATEAEAARQACAGAAVVYHCVNTPYATWPDTLPAIMQNLIRGAGDAGARLVYCDNLYMYGPGSGTMSERTPLAAEGPKGRIRIRLAETLFEAHEAGRVRATSGRGSDFFGPGATNTIAGFLVFPAVLEGKKARGIGALDAPHTLSFIDDFGRGLVRLGREERALGEVWHIPAGPPLTGREFIERVFDVAGEPARIGVHGRWAIRLAGLFDSQMRELLEVLYQFEEPFVMDASKYEDAFGPTELTPLDEAISRSLEWHAAHPDG